MNVEALNCQGCGAILKVKGSVCECEYCGTTNIICGDSAKYYNLINRANKLRQNCEFDRAYRVYDEILAQSIPTADVLWSQLLCEYGIEYVLDPSSSKYIPTLHRIKDESITNSETLNEILVYADDVQKEKIQECAKEIDSLQEAYLKIVENENPYDVFICYKEIDDDTMKQTEDSGIALELYERLEKYGFNVFFSRITLQNKLGVNYEPYIYAALKSALVMVVIGTRPEYFNAVWLKNEWSRFLKFKAIDKLKQIYFACDNVNDLPGVFSQRQAQLLNEPNAIQNIAYNVKKYIETTRESNGSPKNNLVEVMCPNCGECAFTDIAKDADICSKCKRPFIVKDAISKMNEKNEKLRIEEYVKNADIAMKTGDYDKASEYLEAALCIDNKCILANDAMRMLFFVRVKHTKSKMYEQAINYLSKALEFDLDKNHTLITDFLLYLGSSAEQLIIGDKVNLNITENSFFSLDEIKKIKAYYSKAYDLHPENPGIKLALMRMEYLENDHVYWTSGDFSNKMYFKKNGLVLMKWNKKIDQVIPYEDIELIEDKAKSFTSISYKGEKIRHAIFSAEEVLAVIRKMQQGYCVKPKYLDLAVKKLISLSPDSTLNNFGFVFAYYLDYPKLIMMLDKLKEY